jgi:hypothetical protein
MFPSPSNVYMSRLFGKSYIRDVRTDEEYLFSFGCLDAAFHTNRHISVLSCVQRKEATGRTKVGLSIEIPLIIKIHLIHCGCSTYLLTYGAQLFLRSC